jgi:hypothetical protein
VPDHTRFNSLEDVAVQPAVVPDIGKPPQCHHSVDQLDSYNRFVKMKEGLKISTGRLAVQSLNFDHRRIVARIPSSIDCRQKDREKGLLEQRLKALNR